MKITICNFKGGVGKSLISHQLITSFGYGGIEIDPYGSLHDRLPNDVVKIGLQEPFPNVGSLDDDIIFDFGGFADKKLDEALKVSNAVIIPTIATLESVQATVDTIGYIKKYKKPVLVIANMMRKKQNLEQTVIAIDSALGYTPDVIELPFSDAFQTAINENRSLIELSNQKGLAGYSYKPSAMLIQSIQDTIVKIINN